MRTKKKTAQIIKMIDRIVVVHGKSKKFYKVEHYYLQKQR